MEITENFPFGERVRKGREQLGITKTELAERVGVSRVYINRIESGAATNVGEEIRSRIINLLEDKSKRVADVPRFLASVEQANRDVDALVAEGLAIVNGLESPSSTAQVEIAVSRLLRAKRNFPAALHHAEKARDTFMVESDLYNMCKAIYEIAVIDFEQARYPFALSRFQRVESELKSVGITADALLSQVYVHIAMTAACINDTEMLARYVQLAEVGMNLFPQARRWQAAAMLDYSNAQQLEKIGNFAGAIEKYEVSRRKLQENNDYDSAARMYLNIAKCYFFAGEIDRAEKIAREMYSRETCDRHNKARAANVLGEIYYDRNEFTQVEELARAVYMDTALGSKDRARAFRLKALARLAQQDNDGYMTFFDEAIRTVIEEYPTYAAELTVEHFKRQPFRRVQL